MQYPMWRAPLMLLLVGVLVLAVLVSGRGKRSYEEIPLKPQDLDLLLPPVYSGGGGADDWNPL